MFESLVERRFGPEFQAQELAVLRQRIAAGELPPMRDAISPDASTTFAGSHQEAYADDPFFRDGSVALRGGGVSLTPEVPGQPNL